MHRLRVSIPNQYKSIARRLLVYIYFVVLVEKVGRSLRVIRAEKVINFILCIEQVLYLKNLFAEVSCANFKLVFLMEFNVFIDNSYSKKNLHICCRTHA